MTSTTAQLNELIEITRDGERFYQHAIEEVRDPNLQSLFREMASAKTEVIQALTVRVAANHETPSTGGTLMGTLRQVYADTRAALAKDEYAAYVVQLEQAEDRILHAFEDALETAEPKVRELIAVEMPKVRACHDRMRSLKQSMA